MVTVSSSGLITSSDAGLGKEVIISFSVLINFQNNELNRDTELALIVLKLVGNISQGQTYTLLNFVITALNISNISEEIERRKDVVTHFASQKVMVRSRSTLHMNMVGSRRTSLIVGGGREYATATKPMIHGVAWLYCDMLSSGRRAPVT